MIAVWYFRQAAAKGLQGSPPAWDRELKAGGLCEDSRSVELTSPWEESPVNSVIMFAFIHQESEPKHNLCNCKMLKTNTSVWISDHTLDGISSHFMFEVIKSHFFGSSAESLSEKCSFVFSFLFFTKRDKKNKQTSSTSNWGQISAGLYTSDPNGSDMSELSLVDLYSSVLLSDCQTARGSDVNRPFKTSGL